MNAKVAKLALPWARRVWALLPATLRVPALLAAAAGGVALVVMSRGELRELRERDQAAAGLD